jgi:hypothetical protein
MGATTFTTYIEKTERIRTADDAHREAIEQAQHESGRGGYTGTIAEKSLAGFVEMGWTQNRGADHPRGARTAYDTAEALADRWTCDEESEQGQRISDKWGPSGLLRVGAPYDDDAEIEGWLFFGWASC